MKRDMSGRIVQRVMASLERAQRKLDERVNMGPDKVEMSSKEIRQAFDKMTPEQRMSFAHSLGGIETALELLNGDSSLS